MASPRPLRVLHVTVSDQGGAGVACIRLHRALRQLGVESRVVVQTRSGADEGVIQTGTRWSAAWRFHLDRLPLQLYRRKRVFAWWSVNWVRSALGLKFDDWEPDIVHAHWIGDGFVPVEWLAKTRKPVVWTMHDMWPFTGGCHYARDCERYQTGCGACPQLDSRHLHDLSSYGVSRKARAWPTARGTIVSPSPWLADAARQSVVLQRARIEVIPNGLDGSLFKPVARSKARLELGLREDERIVLTGAFGAVSEERKGFSLLAGALRACRSAGKTEKWRLLVFGADAGPGEEAIGIPVSYYGMVDNERNLPRIYQAADIYTLPSLQDNLPNTVVEALACGKPVVAFRAGGLATMIKDGITGRLADPFSTDSLGRAIDDAIIASHKEDWSSACREEFERVYAWPGPAERYLSLYNEMLDSGPRSDAARGSG